MSLWEERERRRAGLLADIADIEDAQASLARGEGELITNEDESRQFSEDIKQRGRAQLGADIG